GAGTWARRDRTDRSWKRLGHSDAGRRTAADFAMHCPHSRAWAVSWGLCRLRASRGTLAVYATSRGRAQRPFCALRMRLLCDPSTWHRPDGPASMARRSRSMSPRPDLGPKPRLGYAASSIERAAERRADAAALAALESDPRARAYVVAGELVVLKKATAVADPLFTLAE